MKFILLVLASLPAVLCAVGALMWICPKKNSYYSSGLSTRQFIGKWMLVIGLCLSLVELGAMKRDDWFVKADDNYYCYRISPDLVADTTAVDSTIVQTDTVISGDSTFTYVLHTDNPNVIEVPFTTNSCGNARYITINVGTAKIKAMFDTGCEYAVCLTYSDYYKIVGTGMVEENKFTGKKYASVADGRTIEVVSFKLPVCNVGTAAFTDAEACVVDSDVTLVGNPLFAGYQITIDDANKKLILKKNDVPPAAGK